MFWFTAAWYITVKEMASVLSFYHFRTLCTVYYAQNVLYFYNSDFGFYFFCVLSLSCIYLSTWTTRGTFLTFPRTRNLNLFSIYQSGLWHLANPEILTHHYHPRKLLRNLGTVRTTEFRLTCINMLYNSKI